MCHYHFVVVVLIFFTVKKGGWGLLVSAESFRGADTLHWVPPWTLSRPTCWQHFAAHRKRNEYSGYSDQCSLTTGGRPDTPTCEQEAALDSEMSDDPVTTQEWQLQNGDGAVNLSELGKYVNIPIVVCDINKYGIILNCEFWVREGWGQEMRATQHYWASQLKGFFSNSIWSMTALTNSRVSWVWRYRPASTPQENWSSRSASATKMFRVRVTQWDTVSNKVKRTKTLALHIGALILVLCK